MTQEFYKGKFGGHSEAISEDMIVIYDISDEPVAQINPKEDTIAPLTKKPVNFVQDEEDKSLEAISDLVTGTAEKFGINRHLILTDAEKGSRLLNMQLADSAKTAFYQQPGITLSC